LSSTWRSYGRRGGDRRLADAQRARSGSSRRRCCHARGAHPGPHSVPARNIFCVGLNYLDHAKGDAVDASELKLPEAPIFFTRRRTPLSDPTTRCASTQINATTRYESRACRDHRTAGRDIPSARALEHVFGYSIAMMSQRATCSAATSNGSRVSRSIRRCRSAPASSQPMRSAIRVCSSCLSASTDKSVSAHGGTDESSIFRPSSQRYRRHERSIRATSSLPARRRVSVLP